MTAGVPCIDGPAVPRTEGIQCGLGRHEEQRAARGLDDLCNARDGCFTVSWADSRNRRGEWMQKAGGL